MESQHFKVGIDRNSFNEKSIIGRVFYRFNSYEDYKSRYPSLTGYRKARDYFRHNAE